MKKIILIPLLLMALAGCIYLIIDTNIDQKYVDKSSEFDIKLNHISNITLEDQFGLSLGKYFPSSIIVDSEQNIYIGDYFSGNVKKYSQSGELLNVIGKFGQGPGEFVRIFGIGLSPIGNIFVVDDIQNRISIFNPQGYYIDSYSFDGERQIISGQISFISDSIYILSVAEKSPYNKQFYSKSSLFSIYDYNGNRVNSFGKFTPLYTKYNLSNYMNSYYAIDDSKLFTIQAASHQIYSIDLNTFDSKLFGFEGEHYKPFKRGVKKGGSYESLNDILDLSTKSSFVSNALCIKNQYLIVEYINNSTIYSANGDTLKSVGDKPNESFIQIYDIDNEEYIGEYATHSLTLVSSNKEGHLMFRDMEKSINELFLYDLQLFSKN